MLQLPLPAVEGLAETSRSSGGGRALVLRSPQTVTAERAAVFGDPAIITTGQQGARCGRQRRTGPLRGPRSRPSLARVPIESAARSLLKSAEIVESDQLGELSALVVVNPTGYGYVREEAVAVIPVGTLTALDWPLSLELNGMWVRRPLMTTQMQSAAGEGWPTYRSVTWAGPVMARTPVLPRTSRRDVTSHRPGRFAWRRFREYREAKPGYQPPDAYPGWLPAFSNVMFAAKVVSAAAGCIVLLLEIASWVLE